MAPQSTFEVFVLPIPTTFIIAYAKLYTRSLLAGYNSLTSEEQRGRCTFDNIASIPYLKLMLDQSDGYKPHLEKAFEKHKWEFLDEVTSQLE